MTPLEVIRQAQADTLIDEDGQVVTLELLSGLSQAELRDCARKVPCPVPQEIEELLSACRGFYGTIEQVEFSGIDLGFAFEAVFPFGLAIAADGFGNFWVVDLHPHSENWGPIYFACHDAPVILYQADTVEEFLSELFKMFNWLSPGRCLRSGGVGSSCPRPARRSGYPTVRRAPFVAPGVG